MHYHLRHAHVVELLAFNTDATLGPIVLVMDLLACSVFDLLHCCDSGKVEAAAAAGERGAGAEIEGERGAEAAVARGGSGGGCGGRRSGGSGGGVDGVASGGVGAGRGSGYSGGSGGSGGGGGGGGSGGGDSGSRSGLPDGLDPMAVSLPLSTSKRLEMIHDAAQGMLMLHAHGEPNPTPNYKNSTREEAWS